MENFVYFLNISFDLNLVFFNKNVKKKKESGKMSLCFFIILLYIFIIFILFNHDVLLYHIFLFLSKILGKFEFSRLYHSNRHNNKKLFRNKFFTDKFFK